MLFDVKGCPKCGVILRPYLVASHGTAAQHVLVVFLFWGAAALWIGWLNAPRGGGELYVLLATLGTIAWVRIFARLRALRRAGVDRRRYFCERCGRHFEGRGAELAEIAVKQIRKIHD